MLEINPDGGADYCCLVLHGLGADGSDMYPLGAELWPKAKVRWLFPDAPMRPITINGGMPMRGWYDVTSMRLLDDEDEKGIRASNDAITEIIEKEVAAGIPRSRIVLAGFSQGGAMALFSGMRQPEPVAAIVAMSCYLPLQETLGDEANPNTQATPVFLAAGENDAVIAAHDTLATAQLLDSHGYSVTARAYAMPHAIVPQEIHDINEFLSAIDADDSTFAR